MIRVAEALAAMRRLPIQPVSDLLAPGPLLILAPHPDDESLGCGGIIAAACAAGAPPYVLILTDGAASHPNSRAYPPARLRALRRKEAAAAVHALGLPPDRLGCLNLPDAECPAAGPAFDATVSAIASLAMRIDAATILATWAHDPHCDHEAAHLIAAAVARDAGLAHKAYPVWGWTLPGDTPLPALPTGRRIDIAPHLAQKSAAIAAHRSQYAGLIADDPSGFQLQPGFMALFEGPYETVLDVPT